MTWASALVMLASCRDMAFSTTPRRTFLCSPGMLDPAMMAASEVRSFAASGGRFRLPDCSMKASICAIRSLASTLHSWVVEARDLIAQIDAFIEQSGSLKRPPEAANERTSLAAIIAGSSIPGEQRNVLLGVVENAMSLQLANMTSAEAHVIERCCNEVRGHA